MPEDLIDVVRSDHAEIKKLFAGVENAGSAEEKRDAFEALVRKLAVHETAEEEVVHPLARSAEGADAVVDQRLEEESEGKQLLSDLEGTDVTSSEFDEKFGKLKDDVLRHAENEEQEEHPRLRDAVDGKQLEQLAAVFKAAEMVAPTHPHPHGPESAVGNMAVGPAVAVVDRARDAVRDAMRKIKS